MRFHSSSGPISLFLLFTRQLHFLIELLWFNWMWLNVVFFFFFILVIYLAGNKHEYLFPENAGFMLDHCVKTRLLSSYFSSPIKQSLSLGSDWKVTSKTFGGFRYGIHQLIQTIEQLYLQQAPTLSRQVYLSLIPRKCQAFFSPLKHRHEIQTFLHHIVMNSGTHHQKKFPRPSGRKKIKSTCSYYMSYEVWPFHHISPQGEHFPTEPSGKSTINSVYVSDRAHCKKE